MSRSSSSRRDHHRYDDYDRRKRSDSRHRDSRNRSDRYGSSSSRKIYDSDRYDDRRDRSSSRSRNKERRRQRSRSASSPDNSRSSRHDRSAARQRSSSHERRHRSSATVTASSESNEYYNPDSSSSNKNNVRIIRASRSRSKSKSKSPIGKRDDLGAAYCAMMYNKSDKKTEPIDSTDVNFDKEKIHQEMEARLIQHLAREGKVYPPPKPQPASHPVFANDGSFLETFKRLQEQQHHHHHHHHHHQQHSIAHATNVAVATYHRPAVPQPQPMFGKRRGGKILKTGIVEKPKVVDESSEDPYASGGGGGGAANTSTDAWSMYLHEVKKYKNVSCDADAKTRPLVK